MSDYLRRALRSVRARLRAPPRDELAERLRADDLTYLTAERFAVLADEIARIEAQRVPGAFLEFGIAAGGSAVWLAHKARPRRRFVGYDVFGMIPPPGDRDPPQAHVRYAEIREGRSGGIGGKAYYGYVSDLRREVGESFRRYGLAVDGAGVALVAGRFEDTLPAALPDAIAFAHVDCDWHDAVAHVLASVAPRMARGAALVLDDWNDWGGCRTAATAFLAASGGFMLAATAPTGVLRRI